MKYSLVLSSKSIFSTTTPCGVIISICLGSNSVDLNEKPSLLGLGKTVKFTASSKSFVAKGSSSREFADQRNNAIWGHRYFNSRIDDSFVNTPCGTIASKVHSISRWHP